MNLVSGLLTARSHVAFLVGIGIAFTTIAELQARTPKAVEPGMTDFYKALAIDGGTVKLAPTGQPLTPTERVWATTAWHYFENNYQPGTGFVNSVDNYPSTALWDLGSYAMALLAASELGLAEDAVFDQRMTKLLDSLERLPLVDGLLPNKAYNTKTLAMSDYANAPTPNGIGWSALDIARIGVPFTAIIWTRPRYTERVKRILARWHIDETVAGGALQGARRGKSGALERVQEGRFGYEQYGAKSLFLLDQDVSAALRYDRHIEFLEVSGQKVAADARLPKDNDGTQNPVLSEPCILEAIEFGLTQTTLPIVAAVYRAQQRRYAQTGTVTAVTEDNLDRPPYFVYSTVVTDRRPWATITPDGKNADAFRTLSVKAAIGWAYVFGDAYAGVLSTSVSALNDPARGWYSGRYESDGSPNRAITANTNGIVLETLLYKTRGPLLKAASREATTGPEEKP